MKNEMNNAANKNQIISARIAAKLADGMTIEQAIDFVLGAGSFKKLAGEIHAALRG